jgi:GT2 family glycosyltransferase
MPRALKYDLRELAQLAGAPGSGAPGHDRRTLVSVVVPTRHRPDSLRRAVGSVLAQELPTGVELEVVVGLSDPASAPDVAAAEALAGDRRVRLAAASRPGPAAARNAALRIAGGTVLAFIDDDVVVQPGWLAAGLSALRDGDLVQGRTVPAEKRSRYDHSVQVDPPSWRWETCNLFASREVVERTGDFDEDWNPTGRVGGHWGEDTVWGWRAVRVGARPAFTRDAVVVHEAQARSLSGWLEYLAGVRHLPLLVREAPEARRHLYARYFVNRRHLTVTATTALLGGAAAGAATGNRRLARGALAAAGATYLAGYAVAAADDLIRHRLPRDVVEMGASLYGSIRHRRVVL